MRSSRHFTRHHPYAQQMSCQPFNLFPLFVFSWHNRTSCSVDALLPLFIQTPMEMGNSKITNDETVRSGPLGIANIQPWTSFSLAIATIIVRRTIQKEGVIYLLSRQLF